MIYLQPQIYVNCDAVFQTFNQNTVITGIVTGSSNLSTYIQLQPLPVCAQRT